MSRARSIAVMTLLWTVAAAILGALFGAGIWITSSRHSLTPLDDIAIYAMVGALIGVVGGGIFSLTLTRQGSGSIEALRFGAFARWGILAGALAGVGGFVLVELIVGGRVHYEPAVLLCTAIGALAGGAAGVAMLALAKRAPVLGSRPQGRIGR